MKAIITDDEIPAIGMLELYLKEIPGVEIAGSYLHPADALEGVGKLTPDIIFLDIQMPDMDGISLAEKIAEVSPDTFVVFVTAYDKYAVDAFELCAADYLLKPVQKDRLVKAIEKVRFLQSAREFSQQARSVENTISISCFGSFTLKTPAGTIKWRTSKVKELFSYFILNQGKRISRSKVMESILPGVPSERNAAYLHTCVYQLRKTIKDSGLEEHFSLVCENGVYLFEPRGVRIDVEEFRDTAEEGLRNNDINLIGKAVSLYGYGLLTDMDTCWVNAVEQALHKLFQTVQLRYVKNLYEYGRLGEALEYLKQAIKANPADEVCHLMLVELKIKQGELRAAKRIYEEYRREIWKELGVKELPSFNKRERIF